MATHKPKEYMWNGQNITLQPGQFVTTRNKISRETGIYRSKVDRLLVFFKNEQQIEQQTTSTSRLISIINYEQYQNGEPRNEPRVSHGRATGEPRVSTKQELKELKNEKKVYPYAGSLTKELALHTWHNESEEEKARAMRFAEFYDKEFDLIFKLPQQLTATQALKILNSFPDSKQIISVFRDMENKPKSIKGNVSVYKTFMSWMEVRQK